MGVAVCVHLQNSGLCLPHVLFMSGNGALSLLFQTAKEQYTHTDTLLLPGVRRRAQLFLSLSLVAFANTHTGGSLAGCSPPRRIFL